MNFLQKIVTSALVIVIITGCSLQKEEHTPANSDSKGNHKAITKQIDSDGDGVFDGKDPNPYVADIPKINIHNVQSVEMGFSFKNDNNRSSDEYVSLVNSLDESNERTIPLKFDARAREKILALQYNKIVDPGLVPNKKTTVDTKDFDFFILSNWRDQNYFQIEDYLNKNSGRESRENAGQLLTKFRLNLENLSGISEISNIQLTTSIFNKKSGENHELLTHPLLRSTFEVERFFLEDETMFTPVESYGILDLNLDSEEIRGQVLHRSQVAITIKDFDYIRGGNKLRYSEVLNKVKAKTAKIIISNAEKTMAYNVTPRGTLLDFIKIHKDKIFINENGEIDSIDDVATTLSFPVNFKKLSSFQMDLGVWSILGDAKNIHEVLKKNKTYIVTYATAKELALTQTEKVTVFKDKKYSDTLALENLREGDVLTIEMTGTRSHPQISGEEQRIVRGQEYECIDVREHDHIRSRKITPSYRECNWIGVTAPAWYTRSIAPRTEPVIFGEDLRGINPYLSIGETDMFLDRAFVSNNTAVLLDNGKRIKFRFEVGRMLGGSRVVSLRSRPDPSSKTLTYGYVRVWPMATRHGKAPRYSHDTSRHTISGRYTDTYTVTIKRTGMSR